VYGLLFLQAEGVHRRIESYQPVALLFVTSDLCSETGLMIAELAILFSMLVSFISYFNAVIIYMRACVPVVVHQFVRLDFKDISTEEQVDIIYVYDGKDANGLLVDQLSGTSWIVFPTYTTTQRFLFIRFTTNTETEFAGFSAEYSSTIFG
jgi:CUB domain